MRRWARLGPKVGDWIELRIVDASLASALFHGIPAARLLARVRLASSSEAASWDDRLAALLGKGSEDHDRVRRAVARHARVALDEGALPASDATLAVLAWSVACDRSQPGCDASLAEIAPRATGATTCGSQVVSACAAYEDRIGRSAVDMRAPTFEACLRLATTCSLGPFAWERLRAIGAQLEQSEIGVRLLSEAPASVFPRGVDDEVSPADLRVVAIDRGPLDALVARDPRHLGPATWRTEHAAGVSVQLATFLADLARLLDRQGSLVAALSPSSVAAPEEAGEWTPKLASPSIEWTPQAAEHLAEALERGTTTFAQLRNATSRGGERALDAIGAEMLRADVHAFASAAFAEVLARAARPRDVIRLVTYFAIAPDPAPAARALGSCSAAELPRILGAWLEAMLPIDGRDAAEASAARVSACIASLKPYPQLYRAVEALLPRTATA